jgi:hypothetical protein
MAGRLTVSTLNNDTGVLATQNGMTGICKAWCNYNGSAQTINGSFNISSVTYNGTGNYTYNFTTAMPNANYAAVVSMDLQTTGGVKLSCGTKVFNTTNVQVYYGTGNGTSNGTNVDNNYNSLAVFA